MGKSVGHAFCVAGVTASAGVVITAIERIAVNMLGLSQSYPTVFGWVKPLLAYLGL